MNINTSGITPPSHTPQLRQGHVWGVARIGQGGDALFSIQDDETLGKMANLLLEPQQEAKTYKDPEEKDIIVTGEDLDILEAQKKVLDHARHHGDKFIIRAAERNLDAMKCAVSVNASFVDASIIDDNPHYLNKSRPLPQLDAEGLPAHRTPDKKRSLSQNPPQLNASQSEDPHPSQPEGLDQFLLDTSTMFNDLFTQPDAFLMGDDHKTKSNVAPSPSPSPMANETRTYIAIMEAPLESEATIKTPKHKTAKETTVPASPKHETPKPKGA
jgi:hypothetical protein